MTKWQEFPIRPQGRPWPGINTRSGKLDDGTGQMLDSSVNVIINAGDKLEKRKGLIRGLDERFAGAVCGLHSYTDECGREWLLVADQGGFSVRQPFAIPSFGSSDAYPSDDFQSDGDPNSTWWNNTGSYEQVDGGLVLKSSVTNGGDMVWFKDASNFSYQVVGEWTQDTDSTAVFIIKAGTVARLEARVESNSAALVWVNASGTETTLGTATLDTTVLTGNLTLSYERDTANGVFTAKLVVQQTDQGAETIQDFTSINAISDADFGQQTAVRIESSAGLTSSSIDSIQGDPI